LPLLVAIALTVAAVPLAMSGVELIRDYEETARSGGLYPADPIYPWFRNEVTSPAVVLATDLQSVRIPAYSSETNVVSRRGSLVLRVLPQLEERASGRIEVPQGSLDVQEFFRGTSLQRGVEILRRHEVDYVMVESGSQLAQAMEKLPGFEPVEEPSERYDVYDVDLQALGRLVESQNTG
jgi:riboflavin biosynthesis pyrimidine reductase